MERDRGRERHRVGGREVGGGEEIEEDEGVGLKGKIPVILNDAIF